MSVERGAKLFQKKCATCHTIKEGDAHGTGPNLWNIVNNRVGRDKLFHYSFNARTKNIIWDHDTLDAFLKQPKAIIPGTTMIIRPMKNKENRRDIIAYMDLFHPIGYNENSKQDKNEFAKTMYQIRSFDNIYDIRPVIDHEKKQNENIEQENKNKQDNTYRRDTKSYSRLSRLATETGYQAPTGGEQQVQEQA